MKIVFVNPLREKISDKIQSVSTFPRISLASIAAMLHENHDVKIIDPVIEKYSLNEFCEVLKKINPDVIGINAYTEEIIDADIMCREIKKALSDTYSILGGPHISAIPEKTMEKFDYFDFGVIGEGEKTCLELIETIESNKNYEKVKGIIFKKDNKIIKTEKRELIKNINELPFPAWHLFDLEKYRKFSPTGERIEGLELPVEGARGCPFDCIFCYRIFGGSVRFKTAKRIVDDIERNLDLFGATKVHFIEGSFGINKKIAIETCDELIKRGLHRQISWETGGRVDLMNDIDLLKKMKQAGCTVIGYGVESGNEEILNKIGKKTNLRLIQETVNKTKEAGIKAGACFIIGLPYETEKTINETINFASQLGAFNPNFAILVPFPGTKIAEMARMGEGNLRLLSENWSDYSKQTGKTLELVGVDQKKLLALQKKAYFKVYTNPKNISNTFNLLKSQGVTNSMAKLKALLRI